MISSQSSSAGKPSGVVLERELLELVVVHLVPAAEVGRRIERWHGRDGQAGGESDEDDGEQQHGGGLVICVELRVRIKEIIL